MGERGKSSCLDELAEYGCLLADLGLLLPQVLGRRYVLRVLLP